MRCSGSASQLCSSELHDCCGRKNELEERMLMNLQKKTWTHGLTLQDFEEHTSTNAKVGAGKHACTRTSALIAAAGAAKAGHEGRQCTAKVGCEAPSK